MSDGGCGVKVVRVKLVEDELLGVRSFGGIVRIEECFRGFVIFFGYGFFNFIN